VPGRLIQPDAIVKTTMKIRTCQGRRRTPSLLKKNRTA
jgi:hypothetical protein